MTFEEDFPSLHRETVELIKQKDHLSLLGVFTPCQIKKHCLDKQRVREAIERVVVTYQENEEKMTPLQIFIELHSELGLEK